MYMKVDDCCYLYAMNEKWNTSVFLQQAFLGLTVDGIWVQNHYVGCKRKTQKDWKQTLGFLSSCASGKNPKDWDKLPVLEMKIVRGNWRSHTDLAEVKTASTITEVL